MKLNNSFFVSFDFFKYLMITTPVPPFIPDGFPIVALPPLPPPPPVFAVPACGFPPPLINILPEPPPCVAVPPI